MKFLVRPYNADFGLLADAIQKGLKPDGIIVDANIAAYFHTALDGFRPSANGTEIIIDSKLERARRPYFAAKASYKELPYVSDGAITIRNLNLNAAKYAQQIFDVQKRYLATSLTSPYLYLEDEDLSNGVTEKFSAQEKLIDAFSAIAETDKTLISLAFSVPSLLHDTAFKRLLSLASRKNGAGIYLLAFNMNLGNKPEMLMLVKFLHALKEKHSRIIFSHAPFFVYCFEPHGVTDFASGINYLTTLTDEYLTREADIGGIPQNYYLKGCLMKATPQNASDLLSENVIEQCGCPYCVDGIPLDTNPIRKHYLFARSEEAAAVNKQGSDLVRRYLANAASVMEEAASREIPLIQAPVLEDWLNLLDAGA